MSSVRDDDLLAAAVAAAREGAAYIQGQARDVSRLDYREKQRADFVSVVDTQAEERIRQVITSHVPGAVVLGEELTPTIAVTASPLFIVDPLDGTTNFLHGYPEYSVSIGVLCEGELAAGAVLNVPHGELFTAMRGRGAFRNGESIRVSEMVDPSRALIGTGFPFKHLDRLDEYQRQFVRITRESAGIRRAGSAALDLCDVACGRFDAFWELHLAPWDIAAGLLIVREAGGVVTDLRGEDIMPSHTEVVASNGTLHEWLLGSLS